MARPPKSDVQNAFCMPRRLRPPGIEAWTHGRRYGRRAALASEPVQGSYHGAATARQLTSPTLMPTYDSGACFPKDHCRAVVLAHAPTGWYIADARATVLAQPVASPFLCVFFSGVRLKTLPAAASTFASRP